MKVYKEGDFVLIDGSAIADRLRFHWAGVVLLSKYIKAEAVPAEVEGLRRKEAKNICLTGDGEWFRIKWDEPRDVSSDQFIDREYNYIWEELFRSDLIWQHRAGFRYVTPEIVCRLQLEGADKVDGVYHLTLRREGGEDRFAVDVGEEARQRFIYTFATAASEKGGDRKVPTVLYNRWFYELDHRLIDTRSER